MTYSGQLFSSNNQIIYLKVWVWRS